MTLTPPRIPTSPYGGAPGTAVEEGAPSRCLGRARRLSRLRPEGQSAGFESGGNGPRSARRMAKASVTALHRLREFQTSLRRRSAGARHAGHPVLGLPPSGPLALHHPLIGCGDTASGKDYARARGSGLADDEQRAANPPEQGHCRSCPSRWQGSVVLQARVGSCARGRVPLSGHPSRVTGSWRHRKPASAANRRFSNAARPGGQRLAPFSHHGPASGVPDADVTVFGTWADALSHEVRDITSVSERNANTM